MVVSLATLMYLFGNFRNKMNKEVACQQRTKMSVPISLSSKRTKKLNGLAKTTSWDYPTIQKMLSHYTKNVVHNQTALQKQLAIFKELCKRAESKLNVVPLYKKMNQNVDYPTIQKMLSHYTCSAQSNTI